MNATPGGISTEASLRALTRPVRRQVVLAMTSGSTSVQQLCAELDGSCATAADSGESLAIQLHHVHLPLLDDAHIVDYDADRRTVRPGTHLDAALSLSRLIEAHEDERSTH